MLSDFQRSNLATLATYLERLPRDYSHFAMRDWFTYDYDRSYEEVREYAKCERNFCGTAACAAGHGPAAGVCMTPREASILDWPGYVQRAFVDYTSENYYAHYYMFGGDWSSFDDTPQGAAKRIRQVLAEGPPANYSIHGTSDKYQEWIADYQRFAPKPSFLQRLKAMLNG